MTNREVGTLFFVLFLVLCFVFRNTLKRWGNKDYFTSLVKFYKEVFIRDWHPSNFKEVLLGHLKQRMNKQKVNRVQPRWNKKH